MNEPFDEPGALDEIDATLLHEISELWSRLDPVPAGLTERTKFALTMNSLEAELAELIQPELAATRLDDDVARAESVTFASSRATVLLTIAVVSASTARIDGWVTTPSALVRAHTVTGDLSVIADETGRFTFSDVPRGGVRFIIWPEGREGGRPVVTPSIDI